MKKRALRYEARADLQTITMVWESGVEGQKYERLAVVPSGDSGAVDVPINDDIMNALKALRAETRIALKMVPNVAPTWRRIGLEIDDVASLDIDADRLEFEVLAAAGAQLTDEQRSLLPDVIRAFKDVVLKAREAMALGMKLDPPETAE